MSDVILANIADNLAYTGSISGSYTAHAALESLNTTLTANPFKVTSAVIGTASLSASATTGFLYIPTTSGSPVGTPSVQPGTVAIVYNTANDLLYVYNTAWKSCSLV